MGKSKDDLIAKLQAENARLRHDEHRFRLQFERTPIPQIMNDSTGDFLDVNQAAAELLGYKRDELKTLSFADITDSGDLEVSEMMHAQVISGSQPYVQFEKQYVRKDGSLLDCKTSLFPVHDEAGNYLYTTTFIEDISERKRRDETLQTLTHDLKNPLTNISSAVGMLVEICNDEQSQKIHSIVRKSVDSMFTLINNLLDLSRLESQAQVDSQPVQLNAFMQNVVDAFSLAADDKGVTLMFEPLQPDVTMELDPELMRQAFDNLLSNALKYTEAGDEVVVKGMVTADEVILQFNDTGLGIPQDEIPNLFERFYRVSTREHQAVDGSGLGLTIIKAIVEQHDGRVWVDSKLGKGSTFYVALPLPIG